MVYDPLTVQTFEIHKICWECTDLYSFVNLWYQCGYAAGAKITQTIISTAVLETCGGGGSFDGELPVLLKGKLLIWGPMILAEAG